MRLERRGGVYPSTAEPQRGKETHRMLLFRGCVQILLYIWQTPFPSQAEPPNRATRCFPNSSLGLLASWLQLASFLPSENPFQFLLVKILNLIQFPLQMALSLRSFLLIQNLYFIGSVPFLSSLTYFALYCVLPQIRKWQPNIFCFTLAFQKLPSKSHLQII